MGIDIKEIQTLSPTIEQLKLSEDKITSAMGYKGIESLDYLLPMIYNFISNLDEHTEVSCGYRVIEQNKLQIGKDNLICHGVKFHFDPLIGIHLRGSTQLVIFTVTIGELFDKWVDASSTNGDHLDSFVIDTIGAELVEAAADWLENEIHTQFTKYNLLTSTRLSPGYCNWNVADQHKLFSLLPEKFCGITLNDSAMMSPRKSISGIIGIGKNVKRLDYQCNICSMEYCYKRK
jgi:hypothetical protein